MHQLFGTEHRVTTDKDISSEAFWHQSFEKRDETFAWLRENAPVSWHEPIEDPNNPPQVHGEGGFWAVTREKDIRFVSQNHELFSSGQGTVQLRPRHPGYLTLRPTFLEMDPPRHTRYRQVMSAAFTPKGVTRISEKINERAAQIIDRVVGAGQIDFVTEVSAKLPMLTVADMIGVPDSLSETFARAADNFVSSRDPEVTPPGMLPIEFALQQVTVLREIGVDLVHFRRENPSSDIATALANAELDGKKLDDDDITSMMLLLAVAGNDTTKQTTTNTVISLARNPDQRAWLMDDFEGRIAASIEEFIRHASPVVVFARAAMEDTELSGQHITKGDKVGTFFCSGNRDGSVFEEPHRFNLARPRQPHVAFGGGGVHYCLGNGVAKAQLRALFSQILTKLPQMEVGEPEYLYSEFIHGVRHLPVTIG